MCNCGCNTCDIKSPLMLNESLAPKQILSEGLKYHMDNNKPLTEHVYRAGSENYFNLWAEARSLYSREILEITNPDDLEILTETHLGHFGILEDGTKVPLDFPMVNEEEIGEFPFEYKGFKYNVEDTGGMIDGYGRKVWQVSIQDKNGDVETTNVRGSSDREGHQEAKKFIEDELLPYYGLDEGTYGEGGEDDRKYALLKVRPENYDRMIDKLQDMNINHTRHSGIGGVIKVYIDRIPDKVLYKLTHDVWVDKFVLKEAKKYKKGDKLKIKLPNGKEFDVVFDGYLKQDGVAFGKFKDEYGEFETKPFSLDTIINEAKKAKKKDNKPIGKPMRDSSGGKAYKVYVKDPKTGNIKTVRFGSGGLKAKINDPKARQAFAKRHKCSTKKDKTKASYWSCRLPRYAKLLGLKSNFTGFW